MTEPTLNHVFCPGLAAAQAVPGTASAGHRMAWWDWPHHGGSNTHVTLCVHGLLRQGRDFDALAHDLQPSSRVVAVDVVGRGHSDWLADPMQYQLPIYVQDVTVLLATLKAQGMQTMDWVGTSMGGLVGLGVAGHPALQALCPVRRLVLNDVGPDLSWPALQRIAGYVGKAVEFASREAALANLMSLTHTFGPHSPQEWAAMFEPMLRVQPNGTVRLHYDPAIGLPFGQATQATTLAGEAVLWGLYDAITARTLVVRGAESDLLLPAAVAAMAARGPKAASVAFAGVGHAPSLVPAAQRAAITAFLLAP